MNDIKKHILSMAPSAQDMLIKAAIKEGNFTILTQLVGIIGETRDISNLVITEVDKSIENEKNK
jgi:hypothetical protein